MCVQKWASREVLWRKGTDKACWWGCVSPIALQLLGRHQHQSNCTPVAGQTEYTEERERPCTSEGKTNNPNQT